MTFAESSADMLPEQAPVHFCRARPRIGLAPESSANLRC